MVPSRSASVVEHREKRNLDLAFGSVPSPQVQQLVDALLPLDLTGTLYVGYPILRIGDDQVVADALLTTRECGVVLIDLSTTWSAADDPERWLKAQQGRQDDLFRSLYNKFLAHRELSAGRGLAFEPTVVSFVPDASILPEAKDVALFVDSATIGDFIRSQTPLTPGLFKLINSAIQRTRTLKPRAKRENVVRNDSRGAILKRIEVEIANLDAWQKQGAIEYPEGPQRIRGLAGSGKTIVLALKAAYLHATHPDWNIAVTFQTRSLYQQFMDHIRRFCFETIEDEPNWKKLRVLHAWGSRSEPGMYSEIAAASDNPSRDWMSAKQLFPENPFEGACKELLDLVKKSNGKKFEMFDAVLIDEAQDFPPPFFQLVYKVASKEKRIIWAYDELQNLGQYAMLPPAALFGVDTDNRPLVELRNEPGRPQQDIVLPVCYRNTKWALTVAHALGFGIYRTEGLVQMFDDTGLWLDVGYEVTAGELGLDATVALGRRPECSPAYFDKLLKADDAVTAFQFATEQQQASWVAEQIRTDLTDEELQCRDILIVLPNAITAKSKSALYMKALDALGISSHLAGVTSSRDVLFIEDSVAITQIYRAKGNEAAVVCLVDAQYCLAGFELQKRRNTLFTAITRSKAWVRICGVGPSMTNLIGEINSVKDHEYKLDFKYPTRTEIQAMARIHRDLEPAERARVNKEIAAARNLFEQIDAGDLPVEALPEDLRILLERLARPNGEK